MLAEHHQQGRLVGVGPGLEESPQLLDDLVHVAVSFGLGAGKLGACGERLHALDERALHQRNVIEVHADRLARLDVLRVEAEAHRDEPEALGGDVVAALGRPVDRGEEAGLLGIARARADAELLDPAAGAGGVAQEHRLVLSVDGRLVVPGEVVDGLLHLRLGDLERPAPARALEPVTFTGDLDLGRGGVGPLRQEQLGGADRDRQQLDLAVAVGLHDRPPSLMMGEMVGERPKRAARSL
jgi:hypothetical protein